MRRSATVLAVAVLGATSCRPDGSEQRTIVAALYPLAYAAERVAGPGWRVVDLSSAASDAHDVELSLDQRAELEEAQLVIYLGDLGFQPQIEEAVDEASGTVVAVDDRVGIGDDPHFWLYPGNMVALAGLVVRSELARLDPERDEEYRRRFDVFREQLSRLDKVYDRSLRDCRFHVIIPTHEAFGWIVEEYPYGLSQFGLAGRDAETDPTFARIEAARELVRDGAAGAIFFEPAEDSRRVAQNIADDLGVPALPLSSLETPPGEGDYLTVMRDNLRSLATGLGCR